MLNHHILLKLKLITKHQTYLALQQNFASESSINLTDVCFTHFTALDTLVFDHKSMTLNIPNINLALNCS